MFLNRKGFFVVLFSIFLLSGCSTVEVLVQKVDELKDRIRTDKNSKPKPSSANKPDVAVQSADDLQASSAYVQTSQDIDLTGSWVYSGECAPRQGLFDLEKTGRHSYKGKVHVFTSLAIGYGRGSYQTISGSYDHESGYISLTSENPKKYQNHTLKIKGAVSNNQLVIDGVHLLGQPQGCQSFKAVKYTKSDKRKEPMLNLSSGGAKNNSLLGKLLSSSKALTEKHCLDYFNLVIPYDDVNVLKINGLNQRLSRLLLDEKTFSDNFGTGYENWSAKDASGFQALSTGCVNLIHQYPALQQKYREYSRKSEGLKALLTGKDSGRRTSLFNKEPNSVWAGNFYYLAAHRAAKIQAKTILDELALMKPTKGALEKIKQYSESKNRMGYGYVFPLNALTANEISTIVAKAKDIYNEKYAIWLKNEKDQYYAALQNDLNTFSPSSYPKTLDGIRQAKAKLDSLAAKNPYYDQSPESKALITQHINLLQDHSTKIAHDAGKTIPEFESNYQGLQRFSRYRIEQEQKILPELLSEQDKDILRTRFDRKWITILSQFDKTKTQEITFDGDDLNKRMQKLDDYAKLIFKTPIETLSKNQSSQPETNIAEFLVENSNSIRYPCDIYAAHPKDKGKPYYIPGFSDNELSSNLDAALEACISGLENDPDNTRFTFQLGRGLYLSEVYDEARTYLEQAASKNYAPAIFYLALMQMDNQGGLSGGIDKAITVFEQAANGGFGPAYVFVQDYRKNLANMKREEERIFNAQYKFPVMMKALIADEYVNPHVGYSIAMLYIMDLMKHMHGWCPQHVSKAELASMEGRFQSANATGYNRYLERYTNVFGHKLYDNALIKSEKNSHPNDKFDKSQTDFDASSDIYTLFMKHQCDGVETLNFVRNAKQFMDTAPPYNMVSQPFWNACMRSTPNLSVPKDKFCGCFLQRARGGGVTIGKALFAFFGGNTNERYFTHKSANDLLDNFWPNAQEVMQKASELRSCKQ